LWGEKGGKGGKKKGRIASRRDYIVVSKNEREENRGKRKKASPSKLSLSYGEGGKKKGEEKKRYTPRSIWIYLLI